MMNHPEDAMTVAEQAPQPSSSQAAPTSVLPDTRGGGAEGGGLRLDAYTKSQMMLQSIYRENMRKLYNFNATQMLEWPSLTCAWLPDRKNIDPDRDYSLQYMAVGTQALPGSQNYINILEFAIPIEEDDDNDEGIIDVLASSNTDVRGAAERGALQFRNVKGHSRIDQTVFTEGPVLKVRAMPQNTDMIAAKLTNGYVCVYDLAYRLHAQDVGEDVPSAGPDVKLRGHRKAGFGLDWHKASTGLIASGSDDGLVMYWDIESQIHSMADQPTSSMIANERDVRAVHVFEGHKDIVHDVSWHSAELHLLASAGADNSIKLWDTRLQKRVLEYTEAHRSSVNALQFHPLASFQVATGGDDNVVKLWDIRKNDRESYQLVYHTKPVTCLEWAGFSESVLASGSNDGRVVMWDLEKVHAPDNYNDDDIAPVELSFVHLGHLGRITDVAWSPSLDEEWMIASCDTMNMLQYYRPRTDVVHDYLPPDMFDVDNGD